MEIDSFHFCSFLTKKKDVPIYNMKCCLVTAELVLARDSTKVFMNIKICLSIRSNEISAIRVFLLSFYYPFVCKFLFLFLMFFTVSSMDM